jgi:hypothetical protein
MEDRQQEQRLLSLVLDGLDDLYDQRFGAAVGGVRDTRAHVWLPRLLIAVSAALHGSRWELQLANVADDMQSLGNRGLPDDDLLSAALDATDDLRQAIAAEI